jgi:hypothetical protein
MSFSFKRSNTIRGVRIMPQLDAGDFPKEYTIFCIFCKEHSETFKYIHGCSDSHTWKCPRCGTIYVAGRMMNGGNSYPFVRINRLWNNTYIEG